MVCLYAEPLPGRNGGNGGAEGQNGPLDDPRHRRRRGRLDRDGLPRPERPAGRLAEHARVRAPASSASRGSAMNRSARALSGGRTGLDRRHPPDGPPRVLQPDSLGRLGGALRARHAKPSSAPRCTSASARSRSSQAPPGDDGRCPADAGQRVERRAHRARTTGVSVRRPRSPPAGRRADAGRRGRPPGPARSQRPSICSPSDIAGSE